MLGGIFRTKETKGQVVDVKKVGDERIGEHWMARRSINRKRQTCETS